jgi:hypothetical protein
MGHCFEKFAYANYWAAASFAQAANLQRSRQQDVLIG